MLSSLRSLFVQDAPPQNQNIAEGWEVAQIGPDTLNIVHLKNKLGLQLDKNSKGWFNYQDSTGQQCTTRNLFSCEPGTWVKGSKHTLSTVPATWGPWIIEAPGSKHRSTGWFTINHKSNKSFITLDSSSIWLNYGKIADYATEQAQRRELETSEQGFEQMDERAREKDEEVMWQEETNLSQKQAEEEAKKILQQQQEENRKREVEEARKKKQAEREKEEARNRQEEAERKRAEEKQLRQKQAEEEVKRRLQREAEASKRKHEEEERERKQREEEDEERKMKTRAEHARPQPSVAESEPMATLHLPATGLSDSQRSGTSSKDSGSTDLESQWLRLRTEVDMEDCTLGEFQLLDPDELKKLLAPLAAGKIVKLRALHKAKISEDAEPSLSSTGLLRIPESDLKLESVLGRGAYSTVWSATWTRSSAVGSKKSVAQTVAVKVPHPTSSQHLPADLLRELAVLANLPHQNLLYLYGLCSSHPPKLVVEYMTCDLSYALKSEQLLTTRYQKLRVLKDIAAALVHLHEHGVLHRDVKPQNVLLRGDQTKLCDLGTSKDLQHSMQHMTLVGTAAYMAPEVRHGAKAGKAADVWSFGMLMFEVFLGHLPQEDALAEMKSSSCLQQAKEMFEQCHQNIPSHRPRMVDLHEQLLNLLMQEGRDYENLKAELQVALAQDLETYNRVWHNHYFNQVGMSELLLRVSALAKLHSPAHNAEVEVLQPYNDYEALEALATRVAGRVHVLVSTLVEHTHGKYVQAPRKSGHRAMQKVREDYDGDFARLLDLERGTGVFTSVCDMDSCLRDLVRHEDLELIRVKDRLNGALSSGYRDVLMNVRHRESKFVFELQLNFEKMAEIKSQTHRFYEMARVMQLQL